MFSKKIGILNFQYSNHNYGAVLQAAALEYILKEEGHDAEHINFIPQYKKNWKNIAKTVLIKLGLLKSKKNKKQKNEIVFEKFRNRFITRSKLVQSKQQFRVISAKYDTIIVGSDQVWRPKMAANPAAFFLKYVPKQVKRIAYAASFGIENWEYDLTDPITIMAKQELLKFEIISCRESSGVKICKNIFNVEATHVLDPLLQVSEKFIENIIKTADPASNKLVYYKLDHDENFFEALKEVEKNYNHKAYNIYSRNGNKNEYEEVSQWLRNIYDSETIVTDSFHCICLGLRFNKNIIYSPNPKRGQARMDDLFEALKISKKPLKNKKSNLFYLNKENENDFQNLLFEMRHKSQLIIKRI